MQFAEANTPPALKRQRVFLCSDIYESVWGHEKAGAVIFQLQSKNPRESVQMPHAETFFTKMDTNELHNLLGLLSTMLGTNGLFFLLVVYS